MDRKNNYQRIELLTSDEEQYSDLKINESAQPEDIVTDDVEKEVELFTPSPQSSSPPKDFDIHVESHYIPLFNENDLTNSNRNHESSSLASSLSIESNHEYATSATVILTNTCRVIRCPVCEKPMRTFYCAKCIQKGHFVTLDTPPNATNIKPSEIDLQIKRGSIPERHNSELVDEQTREEELLQIKLRTLVKRTEALKSLYKDEKLKLEETENLLKENKRQLDLEKKSNKSKESKIELIKRYITSRKASVKKRKHVESVLLDDLKQHASRRIFQLINDVFPIEEVNLMEQNSSLVNMEASPLLTFSDGSYHQIEQQTAYSIVEPWLPANGDYNAYSLWINDNQDHIPAPISDFSERNPAFRIGAGLAFTTQLVKNIASYLDVILPARLETETFNRELLNDLHFSYNVAKLNANVIHLCVTQGIDVSLLNPPRTLKNLMFLFNLNLSDLGRRPIIELVDNEEVARRIEEQLSNDLTLYQEDFYDFSKFADDDDVSDSEWEISDTINPMEMQLANEQSIQQNSYISRLPMRLFASFWSTGS